MLAKKLYFMECHLAGRQYHDADEVWDELKVGTLVRLVRDNENEYDRKAVAVVYDKVLENGEKDEFILGYIPKANNGIISDFLKMGWGEIFECRISKINPDAHYEEQIHLSIKIKKNEREG